MRFQQSLRMLTVASAVLIPTLLPAAQRFQTIDDEPLRVLRETSQTAVHLDRLRLSDAINVPVQLERFEVFAPDAKLHYITKSGEKLLPIPNVKYYHGKVDGDPDSRIFLSVGEKVQGFAIVGEHRFVIHSIDGAKRARGYQVDELTEDDGKSSPFYCDVEKEHLDARQAFLPESLSKAVRIKPDTTTPQGTAVYTLRIALDIDNELLAQSPFNGNTTTMNTYLGSLVGAASTVYQNDLQTVLVIGDVFTYAPGADPWTVQAASGTGAALDEFGTYWHNNRAAIQKSSAMLLSGKNFGGGIAWRGVTCQGDFASNFPTNTLFGGAYGVIGSLTGFVTTNTNSNSFWDLLAFTHELGHNVNSKHTHCIALTGSDITTYGRSFVDNCYGSEGAGCYTSASTSVPAEKGTIMSYCHLLSPGYGNLRLIFGTNGEASHVVAPIVINYIDGQTPTGTITSPASVTALSAGNAASIPAGASTYQWSATNATITSSTTTNAITFTAQNVSPIRLFVTVKNANGCGVTQYKDVTVTGICTAPSITTHPASTTISNGQTTTLTVVATGTSLTYQWYTGNSGDTSNPIGAATAASVNVSPTLNTSYWVRVSNSCGTADSQTAAVGVKNAVASVFYTVTPCRILDTRLANGPYGGPGIVAGVDRIFAAAGVCGIPTDAVSISVNVTVIPPSGQSGFLTMYPADAVAPKASTLNYVGPKIRGNNAIVLLTNDGLGRFGVKVAGGAQVVHVVVDVNGYFK